MAIEQAAESALSKLIAAGENSPVIKKMLQAIKSPEEAQALAESFSRSKAAPAAESDFRNVMKNTDIPVNQDELYNPDVVRNPKVNGLPPAIPREPNLPITRDTAGVPSTQATPVDTAINDTMRDVSPPAPPSEPPALPPGQGAVEPTGGMSDQAKKYLLPAGAATVGLLGLQGDTDNHPADTTTTPPDRQPAAAAPAEAAPKAVAPQKDVAATDEKSADESDTTPSQKTQPAAAEPDTETKAPQKQEPSPLNFEARGNGENELSKLLAQQREDVLGQQLMQGANIMGAGLAKVTPNNDVYEQGIKLAGLPIEQYKERQANEANDPNSGISQGMRDYMKTKLGVNVSDNATASQMGQIVPMVLKDFEAKQKQAADAANLKEKLAERMSESENRSKDRALSAKIAQMQHQDAAAQKAKAQRTSEQERAYKTTQTALEGMRGNPAVQQAERDLYSIQKANTLVANYGNPNNMTPEGFNLMKADIARIAQGAAPTQDELKGLDPKTFTGALARAWTSVSSNTTPANMGAFVKEYQNYANSVGKDARAIVTDRYGRILGPAKRHLDPDDFNSFTENYTNRFKTPTESQQVPPSLGQDPRDAVAIQHIIQQNPGTSPDDAAKILMNYKKSKAQQ